MHTGAQTFKRTKAQARPHVLARMLVLAHTLMCTRMLAYTPLHCAVLHFAALCCADCFAA